MATPTNWDDMKRFLDGGRLSLPPAETWLRSYNPTNDSDSAAAMAFAFHGYPRKPEPVFVWKTPLRMRLRWWIEDFWRYTVKREPRTATFNFRDYHISGWDLAAEDDDRRIDSRSWTGR